MALAASPTLLVEFNAAVIGPGDFVLDSSLLSGPDLLIAWPRWFPVTAGILAVDIGPRGRTDLEGPVQAATCTLTLDNRSGDFDPDNPSSIFNTVADERGLAKGMRIRVSATFAEADAVSLYPGPATFPGSGTYLSSGSSNPKFLFAGSLETADVSIGGDLTAVLTFIDDLAIYGQVAVPAYSDAVVGGGTPTSAGRVRWALAFVQSAATAMAASISALLLRPLVPTYGGGSVLDELTAVATAEAGRVFIDRAGILTVTAHGDDYTAPVVATLTDAGTATGVEYVNPVSTNSALRIVNSATVARYGSDSTYPNVSAGDAASVARYGVVAVTVVAPLANDADAAALAVYLGTRWSKPTPLIVSATVDFVGQLNAAPLLAVDLGDRVSMSRTVRYTGGTRVISDTQSVESITWTIDAAGRFELALGFGPVDFTTLYGSAGGFILDSSLLDGGDVLTPY